MSLKANNRYLIMVFTLIFVLILFSKANVYAAANGVGYDDGYAYGLLDGMVDGRDDASAENKKIVVLPKDSEIIDTYELKKETSTYKSNFLRGYKVGYKEGYVKGYDNRNSEEEKKTPIEYAESVAEKAGSINGYTDYYAGRANKWTYSLPTTTKIIEIYELLKDPNDYKNAFIIAYKNKYKEGYEQGYAQAKFEPVLTALEKGSKDGEYFGALLGANYGRLDYYKNLAINWERDLPIDSVITSTYLLNNDLKDYANAFVAGFKKAYNEKYEDAYRTANTNYHILLYEKGYAHGKVIGSLKGETSAKIDITLEKNSDLSRHFFSDNDVITEYKLFNEHKKYSDGFISGYKEGIRIGYLTTYQNSSFDAFSKKIQTAILPISGGEVKSGDGRFLVSSERGVFYNDIVVSIGKILNNNVFPKMPSDDRFIKASEMYSVRLANSTNAMDKDKTVKLTFEYYGPYLAAGIYKYANDTWVYMPSNADDKSITTFISPKSLNNKTDIYAVFIDSKATTPYDIRGHWAKDEIITYVRRGIVDVDSNNNLSPNSYISKVQLLTYINKVYNKNYTAVDMELEVLDVLKIDEPVTYKEVEAIMKKATNDNNFTWKSIADKIVKIKDRYTLSFNSMNNYITRAEAIYMLYHLAE